MYLPIIAVVGLIFTVKVFGSHVNEFKLNNRRQLIVTILDEPWIMLKRIGNAHLFEKNIPRGTVLNLSEVEGYIPDLASMIFGEKLKIPYQFITENIYGMEVNTGVWSGMMGALVNRSVDVSMAPLIISPKRARTVDFSHPFLSSGISLMVHRTLEHKMTPLSVLNIFENKLWICILLSYILVLVVRVLIYHMIENGLPSDGNYDDAHSERLPHIHPFSFWPVDCLRLNRTHSISSQIVVSVWYFFIFIAFSWYLVHLAVFSMSNVSRKSVDTWEQLTQRTDIKYGLINGSSTMAFFKNSNDKTIRTLWNVMQQHQREVLVSSNDEGITKVQQSGGKYAFFTDSLLNEYVSTRFPCQTMKVDRNIATRSYGIATPHGSELREAINTAVIELFEAGILDQLKQKWFSEHNQCKARMTDSSCNRWQWTATLTDFAVVFYILIIGVVLGIIIASVEYFIQVKHESNRSNQTMAQIMHQHVRTLCARRLPKSRSNRNQIEMESGQTGRSDIRE